MEYVESNDSFNDDMAAPPINNSANKSTASVDQPVNDPVGQRSWPQTAIERQIAAAARAKSERANASSTRFRRRKSDRRNWNRFGFGSFLVLLWLVAVGLIVLFTDFGRALQKAVSTEPLTAEPTVAAQIPVSSTPPPSTATPGNPTPTAEQSVAAANDVAAPSTAVGVVNPNAPAPLPATALNKTAPVAPDTNAAPTDAISIPIADVSLRNRPELLEQLVQVYRAQLAANPSDATTRAALDRLQERSLSDIQALIAEGYVSTAGRSLEIVSRLFPELSENVRYKYLLARTEYMRREVKEEPAAIATPSVGATVKAPEPMKATKTVATSAATAAAPVAATPVTPAVTPSKSAAVQATEKKSSAAVSSSKPEIRSVSIMPGTMVDGRFVPENGGNVFMVELSYSNFEKAFVEQNEATLVTLLGVPDDSLVLAEVPVTISADRGTKSFTMETNSVQGYAGGKFQLNFMLNDEFLTSRTLRLSRPRP